ncbi:MAG: hypothetical protein V9F00_10430 [Nocardioides sp.]
MAAHNSPGSSAYTMHRDGDLLVCTVGKTKLTYLCALRRRPARDARAPKAIGSP